MERMKVEDMVKALKCVEEQLEKQIWNGICDKR